MEKASQTARLEEMRAMSIPTVPVTLMHRTFRFTVEEAGVPMLFFATGCVEVT